MSKKIYNSKEHWSVLIDKDKVVWACGSDLWTSYKEYKKHPNLTYYLQDATWRLK